MIRVTTLVSKALTLDSVRVTRMKWLTIYTFVGVTMFVVSLRTFIDSIFHAGDFMNKILATELINYVYLFGFAYRFVYGECAYLVALWI